ncbi:Retrovirus-related Pol polyprotein from transposon TNT 1-94 [Senna tora]|uniref:Retrovirus-related Pol polyprotein from transposon TNT 1-94 n=1 Tax=Senna tora TaxID=362788 RepID=A0A834TS42_9FABA|nr:Retrovirus-related Pol polyprotein from transposon TNT 1-94 [Senna tora]
MSTHLRAYNLWSYIEIGIQANADDITRRKDQLALAQIHQGVDYSVFGKIANAKNAKEAWGTLKLAYKGVDKSHKSKLQSLRREYERKYPDRKVVEKMLRTMLIKYDHVVTTIIESHNLEDVSVAELQGSMESHVSRILEKTEKPVEEALKSQVEAGNNVFRQMNQGRGGQNFNFQNRGRGRDYVAQIRPFSGRIRTRYVSGTGDNCLRKATTCESIKDFVHCLTRTVDLLPRMIPENFVEEDQPSMSNTQLESSSRPQRQRRLPARLEDYVLGNDNDNNPSGLVSLPIVRIGGYG